MNNLEELYASYPVHFTNISIKNKKLKILDIMCLKINDDAIKDIISLQELNALYNDISDYGLSKLNLKILECNKYITNKGIKHMTNLKRLDASNCKYITDEGIKNLTNLEILAVCRKSGVTDEGLLHLNLKELYSYKNYNITFNGITHMTSVNIYMKSDGCSTDSDDE